MIETTIRVVFYALVAATSPLALAATLAVLRSRRGRINGTGFALSFLVAQAAICFLALAIGAASIGSRADNHETLGALFVLAFGLALLAAATAVHRRGDTPRAPRRAGPRTKAMLERLERLTPGAAIGTGALLGIGGPKRLGLSVIVAGTISAAALAVDQEISLVVMYVLVGTVLVWLPVVLFVVFGTRATEWMNNAQGWVAKHEQPLTFYPSLVLGVLLTIDALIRLF